MVAEAWTLKDPRISADVASDLSSSNNRANYLIVAPRALGETAEALADYRGADFRDIQIVWLDDIYQEFSHGRVDPAAITAFLQRVKQTWAGAPEVLTLLGKGTLDHKDRSGYGNSMIPLRMTLTPWGLAPSDNRMVDVDGDDLMDFTYARLPVSTNEEGLAYLERIRTHESTLQTAAMDRAVLAADNPDSAGDFDLNTLDLAEDLQGYGYHTTTLLHPEDSVRAGLTSSQTWESAFVSYDGHGSISQIGNGSENFLTVADVPALTSSARPVFSALTCLAGDDSQPGNPALASSLLLAPGGGAIATVAPTGLSYDRDAQIFGAAFSSALLGDRLSVGESVRQAQQQSRNAISAFMLDIYQVLGEPMVRLQ